MRVIGDLTFEQAYDLIENGKFYSGSVISDMSDVDLLNCRKYAVDHYYEKWYWVHFYHMLNEECNKRGQRMNNPDYSYWDISDKTKHKSYWNDPRVLDVDPLYH